MQEKKKEEGTASPLSGLSWSAPAGASGSQQPRVPGMVQPPQKQSLPEKQASQPTPPASAWGKALSNKVPLAVSFFLGLVVGFMVGWNWPLPESNSQGAGETPASAPETTLQR